MKVAICADDYALTRPISAAILNLARAGRISAVSCMTASPLWPELAPALRPLAGRIDIGLHLTLVDERPLTAMPRLAPTGHMPSIGAFIAKAYAGTLVPAEIAAELEAQMAAFVAAMGRPPAHIDGHLHAHVLPGVREQVFALAEECSPRPWLRCVTDRRARARPAAIKASFLNLIGAAFTREARARGFAANDGFSGFYGFARGGYAARFPAFLQDAGPRPLILCHPGAAEDDAPWAAARAEEYEFLRTQTLLPPTDIVRISAF